MEWRDGKSDRFVFYQLVDKSYRSHANCWMCPTALNSFVKCLTKHAAKLHGMAVHSIDPGPPVQCRLGGKCRSAQQVCHNMTYVMVYI